MPPKRGKRGAGPAYHSSPATRSTSTRIAIGQTHIISSEDSARPRPRPWEGPWAYRDRASLPGPVHDDDDEEDDEDQAEDEESTPPPLRHLARALSG
ncbi:hypothetical protein N7470_000760 [Penicillium chermesinum]|nr:hypothetical protein N7470_000760 [Penicillium chermesinum]